MKRCFPLIAVAALGACAAVDEGPVSVGSGLDGGRSDGGVLLTGDSGPIRSDSGQVTNGELGCTKMDVLFVIDNSASMSEEQAALAQSFPQMVTVLDQLRDGTVDYRVGVTTTSFGIAIPGIFELPSDDGQLLKSSDMPQAWLSKGDADLAGRFQTLATVGVAGNADEQPLRAAQSALTDRVADGKNQGFFRKDALLAIVVITDEDDSTSDGTSPIPGLGVLKPVSQIKTAIDTAAGGPGRWAAAVIAGAQKGGCSSEYGDASDAERLREFVGLLGATGFMGDICSGMLASELSSALDTFTSACEVFPPLG